MRNVTQPEERDRSSSRFAFANWKEMRGGGCIHPQPCLLEVGLGAFFLLSPHYGSVPAAAWRRAAGSP